MTRRWGVRILVAAYALAAISLGGCAGAAKPEVLSLGQLEIADLQLVPDGGGAIVVNATVTNTSSVDRAFTIRWIVEKEIREQSRLIPSQSTTDVSADDPFILAGLRAERGEAVALTLAEGFFPRTGQPTRDVVVEVTAPGD